MISSGINLQKIGVAATLFAQSFTFGGVIEEVPPFGSQVIVTAEPISQPQSIVRGPLVAAHAYVAHFRYSDDDNASHELTTLFGSEDTSYEVPLADLDAGLNIIVKMSNDGELTEFNNFQLQYEKDGGPRTDVNSTSSNFRTFNGQDTNGANGAPERLTATPETYGNSVYNDVLSIINWNIAAQFSFEFYYCVTPRSADNAGGESYQFFIQAGGSDITHDVAITLTIQSAVIDELEIQRSAIVAAEPITQPASLLTHGTFLADNVELDITRRLVVAAPRHLEVPAQSFLQGSFLADNVELDIVRRAIVPAPEAPAVIPQSFFWPSEDIQDVRLETERKLIVEAPRHLEAPPESLLRGSFLADNVELDIRRQIIVSAEPVLGAVSITRGVAVPEIVAPSDIPEGQSVLVEAEEPRAAISTTHSAFLAEEVFRSAAGVSVSSQGHALQRQVAQSFVSGGVPPDDVEVQPPQSDRIITQAEPIPAAVSITLSGIVPDDFIEAPAEGGHILVSAEPIADAVSTTRGLTVPLIQAPPEGQHTIVEAEPVPTPQSLTQGTFLADELLPIPEELQKFVSVIAEPIPDAISFTHAGVIPDDVVPPEPPVPDSHTLKFTSASRSARFSSVQRQFKFSSVSRSLKISDAPDPLGFILTEDGGNILQENDVPIAKE